MKQLKLAQWDKVLYKQITTMHSEGKPPQTGRQSVYGEIKVTDKYTFSESSMKKLPIKTQCKYFLKIENGS
jgi:hypothetical protein